MDPETFLINTGHKAGVFTLHGTPGHCTRMCKLTFTLGIASVLLKGERKTKKTKKRKTLTQATRNSARTVRQAQDQAQKPWYWKASVLLSASCGILYVSWVKVLTFFSYCQKTNKQMCNSIFPMTTKLTFCYHLKYCLLPRICSFLQLAIIK